MLAEVETRMVLCPSSQRVIDWMECARATMDECKSCLAITAYHVRE